MLIHYNLNQISRYNLYIVHSYAPANPSTPAAARSTAANAAGGYCDSNATNARTKRGEGRGLFRYCSATKLRLRGSGR